jgi:hypothetical protein
MSGEEEYTAKKIHHALLNEDLEYLNQAYLFDAERLQATLTILHPYAIVSKHRTLNTLKWLYDVVGHRPRDSTSTNVTMLTGNIDIVKWMHSKGFPFDEGTFRAAVYLGDMSVLKWLLSVSCPRNESVFAVAAEKGDLEIMMWMRKKGFNWDESACEGAAKKGHFKELMWLRESGCPWDDMTSYACLRSGSVEMLRWVMDNGCPHNLDALVVDSKSFGSSKEMQKFLAERKTTKISEAHKEEIDTGFRCLEDMFEDMVDILNDWFSENAFALLPPLLMEEERDDDAEDVIIRDGVNIPVGYFVACIWPEKMKELILSEYGGDDERKLVSGETLSKYFRWKYVTMKEHRENSERIFEKHIVSKPHAVSHCSGGEMFETVVKKSFELIDREDDDDDDDEWDREKFPVIGHYLFVENEGCCDDISTVLLDDVTLDRMIIPHPVTSLFKK